jgi:hypothetical protein
MFSMRLGGKNQKKLLVNKHNINTEQPTLKNKFIFTINTRIFIILWFGSKYPCFSKNQPLLFKIKLCLKY